MIKLIRYNTRGGSTCLGELETLGRYAAFGVLAGFLSTDRMTACLQPNCRITRIVDARGVLFWRDGDGDGEYAHFEGNAKVIAELTAIFRLLNDNEELREALRQRFCSQTLPDRLWKSTASSAMRGDAYRTIVLMCMAGISDPYDYTHIPDGVHNAGLLVAALEFFQAERDAICKMRLWEFLQPTAKAA